MNKRERVDTVLAGKVPDRLPVSFWYHFGVQHAGGETFAEIALDFFNYYDLDWLKLMNDYYHPLPRGMEAVKTKEDLEKITHVAVQETDWKEQLKALEHVARELEGKAYFTDTVFEPWQTLGRNIAGENLYRLVNEVPDALINALDVITDNLIAYCKESLKRGTAGIFLSTFGAESQMEWELYSTYAYPFALRVFEEIKGLGPMNTVHVHGHHIFTDAALAFPVPVISYEDRHPSNPSITDMKSKFDGCIMGGIDKDQFLFITPEAARRNAEEGLRQAGKSRVLLAPGCSVAGEFYPPSAKALVETVKSS